MNKTVKLAAFVTVMLLLAAAFFVVSAAPSQPAGPSTQGVSLNPPPPLKHISNGDFITTGIVYASLAPGFNVQDSGVKFDCRGVTSTSTCTLIVSSFATSSGGGIANDDRALCLLVDNTIVGACAYNGYDAADGSYSAISSMNYVSVNTGLHSAFMLFYTTSGTTEYTYTNVYSLSKP